ncbi:MAG TPA: hypothetical protein VLB86_09975 [Gaiellaceae bacterium]|nr:hypothetical protein [Gaiellaceae bacterium]
MPERLRLVPRTVTPRRLLIPTLVAAAVLVGGLVTSSPAAAATKPCWKQLINDWYDGRIDKAYPAHCYREAIKNLPEDVEAYSTAREDMERALLAAVRNNNGVYDPDLPVPPGPGKGAGGSDPTDESTSGDGDQAAPPLPGSSGGDGDGGVLEIFRPSSADEIPVPLLVLGGLAVLLLAAAAASFIARKVQARRGFEGGPPLP